MSRSSQEKKDDGYREHLLLPFTTDTFTLTYVPEVTQAVPAAVSFPEQQVAMNESVHRKLYLYVQAASHEKTG